MKLTTYRSVHQRRHPCQEPLEAVAWSSAPSATATRSNGRGRRSHTTRAEAAGRRRACVYVSPLLGAGSRNSGWRPRQLYGFTTRKRRVCTLKRLGSHVRKRAVADFEILKTVISSLSVVVGSTQHTNGLVTIWLTVRVLFNGGRCWIGSENEERQANPHTFGRGLGPK